MALFYHKDCIMPWLSWIEDDKLEIEVSQLLNIAKNAQLKASGSFGKNVIDPFAAVFEISGFNMDFHTWIKSETSRQAQKTLQNHIGNFHQNILGQSKGWVNLQVGHIVDLYSEEHKIIAEIKNKYNTISGGKLADLYSSLDGLISPKSSKYKDYTAYYVAIIPKYKHRYNKPFSPSDKDKGTRCSANELIREIDGASFYSLVTGSETALEDLFNILPSVIKKLSSGELREADLEKLKEFFKAAFG